MSTKIEASSMKTFISIALAMLFVTSCDSGPAICETGQGQKVQDMEAEVRFDQRFDKWVLWRHVPGTIDSFQTFIPCNLPDGFKAASQVLFDGLIGELPKDKEPSTQVGGEEFFVVQLTGIESAI